MSTGFITKVGVAIIVLALADLLFLNYWVVKQGQVIKDQRAVEQITIASPSPTDSASVEPSPLASPSTETKIVEKTVVEKESQTIVQTAQKEIFIPMGSGSTKSREFADLISTDLTVDTSKYANVESIVFEASIWVEGGNGAAYAQLYNVDDKVGYFESQISNNVGSAVVKASGNLTLPNGKKTYRVRAKTDIVEFAAQVSNARIKITLK